MLNLPTIHLEEFQDGMAAIVAAQIQPNYQIIDGSLASLNVTEQRNEYLRQINECVQSIFRNHALTSLTLRYIYSSSNNSEQAKFFIAFLLRSDGENEKMAKQKIHQAWNEFISAFPDDLYVLRPVVDSDLFTTIYQPIDSSTSEVVEIRKFEDIVPTRYVAAGEYYYSVKPINASYTPIEDALKFINEEHTPFVINICFWPTYLTDEEEYTIRAVAGGLYKFATGFSVRLYGGETVFESDINAEICLNRYNSLIEKAQSLAQFKVQIISSDTMPQETIASIARSLFQDYQLEFVDEENKDKAIWTYHFLDPRPIWGGDYIWSTENPPFSLRRISYLINSSETLRLLRLPTLFHKNKSTMNIVFAERIDHMGDKNITIHGNVTNSSVMAFDKMFGDITQTLKTSSTLNPSDLEHFLNLFDEMKTALIKVPAEFASEAEAVVERVRKLAEELKAEKPDKDDLEYQGKKLVKAAENLKQIVPTVLEIAGRIVKFIITFTL